MKEKLRHSLHRRYACRDFDPNKKIDSEDIRLLAESLYYAPSSMGLQPFKGIFVSEEKIKSQIASCSHTQEPILKCSHVLVLMNQKPHTLHFSFAKGRYAYHKNEQEAQQKAEVFLSILGNRLKNNRDLIAGYTREQAYLAMGDMLRVAALMEIDSLVIGGFDAQKLDGVLKEYPQTFSESFTSCVLVALGYSQGNITPKQRIPFGEIIVFL